MSSPLHCHISSLVLSTCDQILHSGFFILYSSLNSVLILELLESNKVPIFKSMMRFDFFRDREAVQGLLLLVFNAQPPAFASVKPSIKRQIVKYLACAESFSLLEELQTVQESVVPAKYFLCCQNWKGKQQESLEVWNKQRSYILHAQAMHLIFLLELLRGPPPVHPFPSPCTAASIPLTEERQTLLTCLFAPVAVLDMFWSLVYSTHFLVSHPVFFGRQSCLSPLRYFMMMNYQILPLFLISAWS